MHKITFWKLKKISIQTRKVDNYKGIYVVEQFDILFYLMIIFYCELERLARQRNTVGYIPGDLKSEK